MDPRKLSVYEQFFVGAQTVVSLLQTAQYPNLSEGADRVGEQLRGDKECPFSGVTKSGSLEQGAGKRCSESNSKHWFTTSFLQQEGARKRCSECVKPVLNWANVCSPT